ncbi:MAG: M1 family metallopeptidase [Chitinophagaceae bacterium]|nr:M1 family metallopeptidase [Chitinophagaceae bacterium]
MTKHILSLVLITLAITSHAQLKDRYSGKDNPLYWKNRMPDAAYWQQDVHYTIDARIDEEKHIIEAKERLVYKNNSPDTLHYVYFHLWQNAFVKGSYLHMLERANKINPRLGEYEAQGLGCMIADLEADGENVEIEIDNTIMKVWLAKPLYPGKEVTFTMDFSTYWDKGATRRRMKMYDAWGFTHYNGVQWFPKMCVYDRKFGWDTHQHLNKEFYADFGTYDVKLNFPSNYIVEATGAIQNRKEVLPDTLREKLDVKNFKDKKWNEAPSIIIPYKKGERKTWHFQAMNVHDFAFTADPTYRINTKYWNGIECVGLVQEPHARGWQTSADYVAKIIKTFSEDFGMYAYPKMVAADAADGMEYPMLTLDGGSHPGYKGLFVHEIGHNWFYGMVGNNETYRASLDEGFTQFLTAWGLTKLEGEVSNKRPRKGVQKWNYTPRTYTDLRVYTRYIVDALNQHEVPLNTHSNDFNNAIHHEGGYAQVYYKTATMLYNMQYVLGDTLFSNAMKNYFNQWKFAHPYFNDFRTSIIQYTKVDLNWFFDQWLETTKRPDYAICNIKKLQGKDSFSIRFARKGEMQMPIDFTVVAKDGKKYGYHIPNTWFEKETEATTLHKWYGWGNWNSTYDAHIQVPAGIKSVEIDTTQRLADIYELDNYKSRCLPFSPKALDLKPDLAQPMPVDRHHMHARLRPDLWWNPVDGIKAGLHLHSDYLGKMHRLQAGIWWNSHILQYDKYKSFKSEGWYDTYVPLNYSIDYQSPINRFTPDLELHLQSKLLDGLFYHRGGFEWEIDKHNSLQLYAQTMWRQIAADKDYLLYSNEWSSSRARTNSSINILWTHKYRYARGSGVYKLGIRAPFLTNGFDYAYAELEAVNHNRLHKLNITTRLYGRYGRGNNIPYESALWLGGANPEQMMENKYTRSIGFVPEDWQGFSSTAIGHFQQGGGLNLRGYAGYLVAEQHNGQLVLGYKGRSGVAVNGEIDFDQYIPLKPKFTRKWLHIDLYAFGDAGVIEMNYVPSVANYWNVIPANTISELRMDAGLGAAVTIKKWWKFTTAKPLTLRVDVPAWINKPPAANPDYFKMRYVVGINRAL